MTATTDAPQKNRIEEISDDRSAAQEINLSKVPQKDLINISADWMMEKTAHLPEEERKLVRWLFCYAKDPAQNWGWKEVERESKVSTTVLYKIWNDKYRDAQGNRVGLGNLCDKIARCKKFAEDRQALRKLPFIETSIWKKVDKICEEARLTQTIAMIYGESQIGKTECLKEHVRRNNHGQSLYVRVPACAGVQLMLKQVAQACYISPNSAFDALRERILGFLDDQKLLIIDEAHLFFETYQRTSVLRCLETLRELHDLSGCGMVLCGTDVFRHELHKGQFAKMLGQLRRRGIYPLQLPRVAPRADLEAIADAYHLSPPKGDAEQLMLQIAKEDGLGKFIKFLSKANQMAHKKGERVRWDHFIRTHDIIAKLSQITPDEPN